MIVFGIKWHRMNGRCLTCALVLAEELLVARVKPFWQADGRRRQAEPAELCNLISRNAPFVYQLTFLTCVFVLSLSWQNGSCLQKGTWETPRPRRTRVEEHMVGAVWQRCKKTVCF
jgi:hypothetical protein